jgi:hypothetical protein
LKFIKKSRVEPSLEQKFEKYLLTEILMKRLDRMRRIQNQCESIDLQIFDVCYALFNNSWNDRKIETLLERNKDVLNCIIYSLAVMTSNYMNSDIALTYNYFK